MPRFLSKTGHRNILRRIAETGGFTEDMEKDLQALKDDFDEREGMLIKYGESYDGEDEYYDYKENEVPHEKENSEDNIWKKRYMDRFFGSDVVRDEGKEIYDNQKEDVKRDSEPQTFDELLKDVEGDERP